MQVTAAGQAVKQVLSSAPALILLPSFRAMSGRHVLAAWANQQTAMADTARQ